jgi:hypothetical protein
MSRGGAPGQQRLPCQRSFTLFGWEDGSPPGDGTPSSLAELEQPGYSHWGGNSTSQDPSACCNCVRAAPAYPTYHFYTGTSLQASRRTLANYNVSASSSNNLLAWESVFCELHSAPDCNRLCSEARQSVGIVWYARVLKVWYARVLKVWYTCVLNALSLLMLPCGLQVTLHWTSSASTQVGARSTHKVTSAWLQSGLKGCRSCLACRNCLAAGACGNPLAAWPLNPLSH